MVSRLTIPGVFLTIHRQNILVSALNNVELHIYLKKKKKVTRTCALHITSHSLPAHKNESQLLFHTNKHTFKLLSKNTKLLTHDHFLQWFAPPKSLKIAQCHYPSCCWIKGFGIASIPSCGQMRTTEVPLQTTSPSWRVSSVNLYWSSGSEKQRSLVTMET